MVKFIVMGLLSAQLFAGTIWTDDFESNTHGLDTVSVQNWDVFPSVDVVGPDLYGIANCHSGTHCVDMDGTGVSPGRLVRITTVDPGNYTLVLSVSGSQRNYPGWARPHSEVRVVLSDGVNEIAENIRLRWNDPWTTFSLSMSVVRPELTVIIRSFDNNWVGLLVDDVSLYNSDVSGTHMPEPGIWASVLIGLILIYLGKRA